MKVVSHPEDLLDVLCDPAWRLERVGLEAGPLSQWLFSGLAEAGVPAICIETRHAKAFLKAQVNKSDRNDARGIAQMMRVGLFRPVHVKTLASQKRRALLAARKILEFLRGCINQDEGRRVRQRRGGGPPYLRSFDQKKSVAYPGRFSVRVAI